MITRKQELITLENIFHVSTIVSLMVHHITQSKAG